jgi:hypothetical protein
MVPFKYPGFADHARRDICSHSPFKHSCVQIENFMIVFRRNQQVPSEKYRKDEQPWRVQYTGESGIDAGGLFRDSLTQLCQELQNVHLPLLIPCPNARHGVGLTLDKYIPNPGCNGAQFASFLSHFSFFFRIFF